MKRITLSISISIFLIASIFALDNDKKAHYVVKGVEYARIEMNNDFDSKGQPEIKSLIESYKSEIDSMMNVVIGKTDQDMLAKKPESLLSNFATDAMRNAATRYIERPADFAIINWGGLRSTLNKGDITLSEIYQIFAFENEFVIIKMIGSDLNKLFSVIAADGGIGVSGVKMIISNNKAKSVTINGQPIDPEREYYIATIDYLAEGNLGLEILTKAVDRILTGKKLRDLIIENIKETTASGKLIHSELENRITIEK